MTRINRFTRCSLFVATVLSCCGALCPVSTVVAQDEEQNPQRKLSVVCSTTQIADFARQIVGDRWEVICVLAPGEDPHTYETGNDLSLIHI